MTRQNLADVILEAHAMLFFEEPTPEVVARVRELRRRYAVLLLPLVTG